MTEDRNATERVDRLLAQVRAADARPDADFLARMVALAEAAQPQAPPLPRPAPSPTGRGLFALFGWPALGGMVAATVAGFWLGVTPPDGLSAWAAEVAGQVVDIGFYGEEDVLALLEG